MTEDMEARLGAAMARVATRERVAVAESWQLGGGGGADGRVGPGTIDRARPIFADGGGRKEIMDALGISRGCAGYALRALRAEEG
jgi:hypothetical protein